MALSLVLCQATVRWACIMMHAATVYECSASLDTYSSNYYDKNDILVAKFSSTSSLCESNSSTLL